ncbi:hypothetical protein [Streptomyces sp. 1331.2]|uniref:hypothetical protein n=1 Tax=Streptomyces sp. 1331.2 TaxID=1938835 RepID=UPI000BCF625B|nr:hypothetical protein [Streptomyces sp. 1331.2]SOB89053.1 hypothetical protein SAMN06272789_7385 [Streptomyces sp. 1331.2]
MPITPNPPQHQSQSQPPTARPANAATASTGAASWEDRLERWVEVCASQLSWWGHDFTDGAWPDTEDLAVLLTRTVHESAESSALRPAHHALTGALGSVHAAERWLLPPSCAAAPAMACRHLREAADLLRTARRQLSGPGAIGPTAVGIPPSSG